MGFRVTAARLLDPDLGQKEMKKIEQEEKEKAEKEAKEEKDSKAKVLRLQELEEKTRKEAEEAKKRAEEVKMELERERKILLSEEKSEKEKLQKARRKMQEAKRLKEERERKMAEWLAAKPDMTTATPESGGEEEEEEEEEEPWETVDRKKKRSSTGSTTSPVKEKVKSKKESTTATKKEERKRGGGGGGEAEDFWGIQQESLARQRMIDARPKSEDEKYGDDGKMSYMAFRRKFKAVTSVKGINDLDILTEISFWLRGTPKAMVQPFKEIKDAEDAMAAIWETLDGFYAKRKMTAEERMKNIMERPPVTPTDIDSVMGMLAALQGVWLEAKMTKSEDGLNKEQIIQDLLTQKMNFMTENFFKKQYKMMKSEPTHRRGFHDLIEDLEEKAHIMKSIGMYSKSYSSGKEKNPVEPGEEKNLVQMAPAQVSDGPRTFSD